MNNKINEDLSKYPNLRLVGDNISNGICSYFEAIAAAQVLELDLVCISETANPPVCKIIDYQKFLYQQKRKEKEKKANATKTELKEIKFSPQIGENDYQVKLKQGIKFLKEGNKVKAFVFFSGRQVAYKNQGEELLNRFITDVSEVGQVEAPLKMEGNRKMIVILSPKKKK